MATSMDKINKLRDDYYAMLFILDSVIKKLGEDPYMLSESPSSEYILKWQMEMKDEITKMKEMIMKEEEKRFKNMNSSGEIEKEESKSKNPGDYLVVEDKEKPSTYHLQVKKNGQYDRGLCGAAWAALFSSGGFRGNKYEGPDKDKAKKKLKTIYKKMGWETPKQD